MMRKALEIPKIILKRLRPVFSCSGRECLEKLEHYKDIKLVLLDIKMPKQNGLEVTREIKRVRPDTKIIIVTGYASPEIAQRLRKPEQTTIYETFRNSGYLGKS
jgi:CheY-like chemotaxis protein